MKLPEGLTERYRRSVHVLAAAVIVASFLGFFAGTRHDLSEVGRGQSAAVAYVPPEGVLTAPTYADLRTFGPVVANRDVPTDLQRLVGTLPNRMVQIPRDLEARPGSVVQRGLMRAFDGAPPTVPHAIDQAGTPACGACHSQGLRVSTLTAAPMSHPAYTNCLQCHVPSALHIPGATLPLEPAEPYNSFAGLRSPTTGERAWPGAPPTIPHTTQMRSECMSCHGPLGRAGLRTSHPSRQSCTQCHAPSADLDQRTAMWMP